MKLSTSPQETATKALLTVPVSSEGLQEEELVRESHVGILVKALSHQESQFVGVLARGRHTDGSLHT